MKPGYDVKLLESNGVGYEVFQSEIDTADREMTIALVGQLVSTTGGTGFSSQELPLQGLSDLHGETGDALAYTVNTQIIPPWVASRYGINAIPKAPLLKWDTAKPKDRKQVADGWFALANAIEKLIPALAQASGRTFNFDQLFEDFGLPMLPAAADDGNRESGVSDPKGLLEEAKSLATQGEPADAKALALFRRKDAA
jgi:hypothetical protein